jgi:hypothetical protein
MLLDVFRGTRQPDAARQWAPLNGRNVRGHAAATGTRIMKLRFCILATFVGSLLNALVVNGGVVISEFRTRGPNGPGDEFVELYNNSDTAADVSGWKIKVSSNSGGVATRLTIAASTTILAHGHFLATFVAGGYSGSIAGDKTYTAGFPDDGGIGLTMADDSVVDQVGMSSGSAFKEGAVLMPLTVNTDGSYERKTGGGLGSTQDTNDNASDFAFRSPAEPQNLSSPPTPGNADQVVSDLGDSGGANQLRARMNACIAGGGGTITFSVAGTVVLTADLLPLINSTGNAQIAVTIDGGSGVTISGNDIYRIFYIGPQGLLRLRNLTVTHAYYAPSGGGAVTNRGALIGENVKFLANATAGTLGSAIHSVGPLTLTGCEIGSNTGGVAVYCLSIVATVSGSDFHDNQNTSSNDRFGGALRIDNALVEITNSSFTNNTAPFGAAIYSNWQMTIDGSAFTGNKPPAGAALPQGGAIFSGSAANTTVTDSIFNSNASDDGGAIYVQANSTLNISGSVLTANVSTYGGGGIESDGTTTVTACTFATNHSGAGGGISARQDGTLTIDGSTFAGNTAKEHGGGVLSMNAITATNSTFSGNSTGAAGVTDDAGGAIALDQGNATLTNLTCYGNASTTGSGLAMTGGIVNLTLTNTVLTKSARGGNCSGAIGPSFNLSDDNTCGFGSGRNKVTNILLGPLANNGGFTKTHMPQPGSAVIDRGTGVGAPNTDQRGVPRPQGASYDVGAVEYLPLFQNESSYVKYNGWHGVLDPSADGGSYRASKVAGDNVSFAFTGTSLTWITRKAPAMGIAHVTIDGVNKGNFDLYNASVLWKQQILFANLSSAAHTIVIKVTGTKNANASDTNIAVDGFLVGTTTTAIQETTPAVQYNSWVGTTERMATGGSYRASGILGAVARLNFKGSSISFITARGPAYGVVDVVIDGVVKSSSRDLYAVTQEWQYQIDYTGLADTNHVIEIRPKHLKSANSSGYGVVVDAFTGPITALQ